ncbi:MAG TPA: xanthine dehydrogenase family protein subunit M [Gemmatimonadaceae bacterium]|nr:xanthine dehydrogenase family protein subunit M [Gemmatimonadaceae bacterium]
MKSFDYTLAHDVADAINAASATDARFVAGGTTLLDLMKLDVETPTHVIDINALPASDPNLGKVVDLPGGGLRIGALARMSDTAWDPRVRDGYPMLSQSLLLAASGQIRNMASIGGNVLQRTRCYYFRDTATPCNKREPGTGCSALHGINRIHAILGASDQCIATHPSDLCVALAALDAVVHVRGAGTNGQNAERTIPFTEFHLVPDSHPDRENVLRQGDLITAIDVPALSFARRSLYRKVRDRASYAFALASAAVAVDLRDGVIHDSRIAFGGIATKPWRSKEAERALAGKPATAASYRAAAEVALHDAVPRGENAFKIELAKRTLVRALTEVTA